MVVSRISYAPQLPMNISLSPLLTGLEHEAPSSPSPLTLKCPEIGSPHLSPKLPKQRIAGLANQPQEKPLPSAPARTPALTPAQAPSRTPLSASAHGSDILPSHIIRLLNVLEAMEDDVASEVRRVGASIRDARRLVQQYREERMRRGQSVSFREL
ncbi:uncharacterized protein LAESUDRAFT_721514 [Laetiporus sulphureus 93-53]|uniref:Uncharacterized protein n=1 Tax=Laetiporus sulphureus 93-53 TaxID=1314785 RepID=A0A165H0S4_9APHY|nr:uncharacterized protein LAESUDRAFT_721514 [Laetiporus sulphureus 93-53]KZT11091.1 hypothetical protein LAESUDRAFT_721514 [Laetiporus sulphureus 93-53]